MRPRTLGRVLNMSSEIPTLPGFRGMGTLNRKGYCTVFTMLEVMVDSRFTLFGERVAGECEVCDGRRRAAVLNEHCNSANTEGARYYI